MLAVRCVLGMTVLLAVAGAAMRLSGGRWAAKQRHAVWTVALVLSVLLPVLLRYEPPAMAISSPAVLEVQRITISVTPEDSGMDYGNVLRWAWLGGMAAVAGWWLLGFVRVSGMVASSTEHSTLRGVAVRVCPGLKMPGVAAGPVILLPESAEKWPGSRLEMVLAHELAHVRRRDLFWRLAGMLACCLYWFHPLAWWAAAQQRKESEMACDDQVLEGTGTASAYADSLMAVAREAAAHRTPAAVMAMAKPRELEGRLLAVLDPNRRRMGGALTVAAGALLCGLALVTPLAAWQDPGVQMKGTVRDGVGVIPGAKVVVKGGSDYAFESGADGSYAVTGVPDGSYSVEVLKPGYAKVAIGGRKLEAGTTVRADFYLSVGGIHETVTVNGGQAGAGNESQAAPQRIRVGGNVQAAKLVKKVQPLYPPEAKQAGVQGTVRIRAVIGKDGTVQAMTLLMAPSAELARSAMDAVNQWQYKSTLLNGSPVEIQTEVDVNYTLTK